MHKIIAKTGTFEVLLHEGIFSSPKHAFETVFKSTNFRNSLSLFFLIFTFNPIIVRFKLIQDI
jgi:hypothetical protein